MIIPVRCFTCGKVIGNKWETYLYLLQADYSEGWVCDRWVLPHFASALGDCSGSVGGGGLRAADRRHQLFRFVGGGTAMDGSWTTEETSSLSKGGREIEIP